MNQQADWACSGCYAGNRHGAASARHRLPLYSLETFTPLCQFDVLGITLQHDLSYANVLTILDLGGVPLHVDDRQIGDPLVIAGGPCVQNPEPMARFIDLFVVGDGEEALPQVCQEWLRLKAAGHDRPSALAQLAARFPFAYVPRFYQPQYDARGRALAPQPLRDDAPLEIRPAVVEDLDAMPLPTSPVVPNVETVQDRIAIEIMRGCPWRCRFCQSDDQAAFAIPPGGNCRGGRSHRNTGYNEMSLLSPTSDYPHFEP